MSNTLTLPADPYFIEDANPSRTWNWEVAVPAFGPHSRIFVRASDDSLCLDGIPFTGHTPEQAASLAAALVMAATRLHGETK